MPPGPDCDPGAPTAMSYLLPVEFLRGRGIRCIACLGLLTLCALIQTVAAADHEGNYAVWGVGAKSCHTFSQSLESGNVDSYRDYVMGYLTAYNALVQDTYRIEGGLNLDQVMAWIQDYCELKPINGFEQALSDFTAEHVATRSKHPPNRYGR